MVTKDLSEAAVEFKSILENCSDDIVNKIPTNFLKFIDKIASKTYKFNYDKTKSLIEQNLKSEKKLKILTNLENEQILKMWTFFLIFNKY